MWKISTLFWGTSGICVYSPRRCAPRWINHISPRCLKITYTYCRLTHGYFVKGLRRKQWTQFIFTLPVLFIFTFYFFIDKRHAWSSLGVCGEDCMHGSAHAPGPTSILCVESSFYFFLFNSELSNWGLLCVWRPPICAQVSTTWPDFEGRCGEVPTSPEIVLHLPWEFLHPPEKWRTPLGKASMIYQFFSTHSPPPLPQSVLFKYRVSGMMMTNM
jgi:hypothetical protein